MTLYSKDCKASWMLPAPRLPCQMSSTRCVQLVIKHTELTCHGICGINGISSQSKSELSYRLEGRLCLPDKCSPKVICVRIQAASHASSEMLSLLQAEEGADSVQVLGDCEGAGSAGKASTEAFKRCSRVRRCLRYCLMHRFSASMYVIPQQLI